MEGAGHGWSWQQCGLLYDPAPHLYLASMRTAGRQLVTTAIREAFMSMAALTADEATASVLLMGLGVKFLSQLKPA